MTVTATALDQTEHDQTKLDQTKLEALLARAVGDLSAGYGGVLVRLGARLGLYGAMAGAGPLSAAELAARAGCAEHYVREWLNAQAAGGYVDYHAVSGTYELSPEQALVLADEDSPVYMPHAWQIPAALWAGEDRAVEAFRSGRGVAWGDHDARLHRGVAAFYRNAYRGSLVAEWLEAFPRSRFYGFDAHAPSIAAARRNAAEAGLEGRVAFEVAGATDFPGRDYGLVCFFDCLHDMGDPVAAARYAAGALAPDGTVLLVEPFANDRVEDNLTPVGRLYYAASTMICSAHAIAEGGRLVLGTQAGEARLAEVFRKGGFTRFRRAAQTPFNLILEARR
jgi:SAM-dependent methyltransferase